MFLRPNQLLGYGVGSLTTCELNGCGLGMWPAWESIDKKAGHLKRPSGETRHGSEILWLEAPCILYGHSLPQPAGGTDGRMRSLRKLVIIGSLMQLTASSGVTRLVSLLIHGSSEVAATVAPVLLF